MQQRQPFPGRLEKNVLGVGVENGTIRIYNGFVDKQRNIYKRPGLLINQEIAAPGAVQAIYYWPAKGKYVAVVAGDIYAADSLTSAMTKVTTEGERLRSPGLVKIIDTGYWLYFCSTGGKMMIYNGTDAATFVTDAAAPTNVSSIATLNKRVIANDFGSNRIWYTDPASLTTPTDELTWSGYVEYGRINETVIGLDVSGGELVAFKRDTMQAFFDDGATPYKPILGSQQRYGLINANAMGAFQNALYFVAPDTTIYRLQNREIQDISTQYMGRELDGLLNVNTVSVFQLEKKIVFNFPDEDLTYIYDPVLKSWSNLTTFDSGVDKAFLATCATVTPAAGATNLWLIGGSDGVIFFWDPSVYTDAGNPIRFSVRTPHIDWGTLNRKQSTRLVVKVSTDSLRESQLPAVDIPPATRCVVYYHQIEFETGVSVSVTGLPTGFSATTVANVLTISGSTEDTTGSFPITIRVVDARGAVYEYTDSFVINDITDTLSIGVL